MPILGLGNDLVEIARIEQVLAGRTAQRFVKRVLTPYELDIFQAHNQPARYLAKRWAAKEAAAKALGTGIAAGISFQDFEISNSDSGQPLLILAGAAQQLAAKKGVTSVWLSLSDEQRYALATVVLEG